MPIEDYRGKRPKVSGRAFVHPTAYVIGDVEIGDLTGIWHYVVVRGDNDRIVIGNRSNIQENSTVHTDYGFPVEIGDGVTVGHNAVVHGAKVGRNCIIGMGAILLNGAEVAEDSIVGAGAVVSEGKRFPPRSLILGVPAKVVRTLEDRELKFIEENAEEYVRHITGT